MPGREWTEPQMLDTILGAVHSLPPVFFPKEPYHKPQQTVPGLCNQLVSTPTAFYRMLHK